MNFATPSSIRPHWNYFLALEKDLEASSRYVEFCTANLDTYSIEFAHLLLSSASEIDTIAKCICAIIDPSAKADNINEYRKTIKALEENETFPAMVKGKHVAIPIGVKDGLSDKKVYVPRHSVECTPWKSWAEDKNPDWWTSYNKVKHERNLHFNKATLRNVLNALAGLLAINYLYCRLELSKKNLPRLLCEYRGKSVTKYLQPESTFMRFGAKRYYADPLASLGSYVSSISKDVERLSGQDRRLTNNMKVKVPIETVVKLRALLDDDDAVTGFTFLAQFMS